jgi:RND family efflux transporter MFP subunit
MTDRPPVSVVPVSFVALLLLVGCGTPDGDPREIGLASDLPADAASGDDHGHAPIALPDTSGAGSADGGVADAGSVAPAGVHLSEREAQAVNLRYGTVRRGDLHRSVRTSGAVEYAESEMRWVSPKVGGWIERLHVRDAGSPVRRGEPLLSIYSPDLVSAQKELLLARRLEGRLRASGAEAPRDSLVALARRRLAYWDISEDQIDRLLRSGQIRKTMVLHAPFSGVVMRKEVHEGQGVEPGENLMMVAPVDPVWIRAAVYGADLPFVEVGTPARVTLEGLPGRSYRARIAYLYPELEASTRSARVRIEVRNPDGAIRPGMFARVTLEAATPEVLSVPGSAVLETGTRQVVFVARGDGGLVPRTVRLGRRGDHRVEVLEGLREGERVATSAQFLLDSEANLAEAMEAMAAEMGGGHGTHGEHGATPPTGEDRHRAHPDPVPDTGGDGSAPGSGGGR